MTHSDIRNHLVALKNLVTEHRFLLTINPSGVYLSSDDGQFIHDLDEVAETLTTLEENRTGDRLRA